jgi:hypothetical protein
MTETEFKLRDWRDGSTQAERLCAGVLAVEGYSGITPSAPLGGPDGGRDIVFFDGPDKCVAAVYFPPTEKDASDIRAKFDHDLKVARQHQPKRFLFMTNQRMSVQQRDQLRAGSDLPCEFLEREALATVLDAPRGYGLRLEYLNIEMNREEQLAHWQEWKSCITHSLGEVARGSERLRQHLEGYVDDRLEELRSRNQAVARVLVLLNHLLQAGRPVLGELQRTRPFLAGFVQRNMQSFQSIEERYRAYVASDSSIGEGVKGSLLGMMDQWKQLLEQGVGVFADGKEDEFVLATRAAFEKVVASLDPKCPRSAEEIRKELEGPILAAWVKQTRPLRKLQALKTLLLESDELLDRAVDERLDDQKPAS